MIKQPDVFRHPVYWALFIAINTWAFVTMLQLDAPWWAIVFPGVGLFIATVMFIATLYEKA